MKDENSHPTRDDLLPPSLLGNAILLSMAQPVKSTSLKLVTYWLRLTSISVSQVGLALFPGPQARPNHCSLNSRPSCLKVIDTFHRRLTDGLFRKYRQGFYVHAKPRVQKGQGIGRYIGRYIRHPAIADRRIVGYDGEQVTFYYKERSGGERRRAMPVLEFIHGVVRHIPPKHFKMVRYYGLYAPRKASLVRALMERIGKTIGRMMRRLGWRERIKRDFHRDPLICPRCGSQDMVLYSLTLRWKGRLVTIGGINWLLERGDIIDLQPSILPMPISPLPVQLALVL